MILQAICLMMIVFQMMTLKIFKGLLVTDLKSTVLLLQQNKNQRHIALLKKKCCTSVRKNRMSRLYQSVRAICMQATTSWSLLRSSNLLRLRTKHLLYIQNCLIWSNLIVIQVRFKIINKLNCKIVLKATIVLKQQPTQTANSIKQFPKQPIVKITSLTTTMTLVWNILILNKLIQIIKILTFQLPLKSNYKPTKKCKMLFVHLPLWMEVPCLMT